MKNDIKIPEYPDLKINEKEISELKEVVKTLQDEVNRVTKEIKEKKVNPKKVVEYKIRDQFDLVKMLLKITIENLALKKYIYEWHNELIKKMKVK